MTLLASYQMCLYFNCFATVDASYYTLKHINSKNSCVTNEKKKKDVERNLNSDSYIVSAQQANHDLMGQF